MTLMVFRFQPLLWLVRTTWCLIGTVLLVGNATGTARLLSVTFNLANVTKVTRLARLVSEWSQHFAKHYDMLTLRRFFEFLIELDVVL